MLSPVNIEIDQGSSWSMGVTVTQPGGSPMDLTGYMAACQFRASRNGPVVATPSIDITSQASSGILNLSLTALQTSSIPVTGTAYNNVSVYYYDLLITSPSSVTTRILNGSVSISPGITQ